MTGLEETSRTEATHEHDHEHMFYNTPNEGATIGKYIKAQHHADGLFSEVFKALGPQSTKEKPVVVALKLTTPSVMTPPHDSIREARILSVAESTNIIPLIETFQQPGGRLVLVFPFMPFDLDHMLREGKVTQSSCKTILRDLFSALEQLHSMDIIHRDVKPSNILLRTPTGPAYLADFGISWSASDKASEPADQKILDVGTTSYRPPELLFGNQAYNASLDMWAAGCVAAQIGCLGHQTLFDSGELGSELALIKSIFESLGTPDTRTWPVCNERDARKGRVDSLIASLGSGNIPRLGKNEVPRVSKQTLGRDSTERLWRRIESRC